MEVPRVDLDHLRDLMKLMDQFSFDELEVRDGAQRLHLSRNTVDGASPAIMMPQMAMGPMAAAPAAVPAGEGGEEALAADIKVITSPMVGTFYRSPSPDAATFVEEGREIEENTVLCIIEAMKVMNEIKAECSGTLVKILVANGEAVEYGEPLFHVKKS